MNKAVHARAGVFESLYKARILYSELLLHESKENFVDDTTRTVTLEYLDYRKGIGR